MSETFIGVHVRAAGEADVQDATTSLFSNLGWNLVGNEAAAAVVDDEDRLPPGNDWYGLLLSGASDGGWVSLYVDDWQDSGLIARGLSQSLKTPVLEVWVAEETHWGYTYFEDGAVSDRFADDPSLVADTPAESRNFVGRAAALSIVLTQSVADFEGALRDAHRNAGQFVGPGIDALAAAVGLPFEHLMMGYEDAFEDDPADYGPTLEDWPEWRHLSFRHPKKREALAD